MCSVSKYFLLKGLRKATKSWCQGRCTDSDVSTLIHTATVLTSFLGIFLHFHKSRAS